MAKKSDLTPQERWYSTLHDLILGIVDSSNKGFKPLSEWDRMELRNAAQERK